MTQEIIAFTKVALPFGWLGNMAPFPVTYRNIKFRSTEHLFHWLRFPEDHPARQEIVDAKSPFGAKCISKKHRAAYIVEPTGLVDVENMRLCIDLKTDQHEHLKTKLVNTGNARIIEDVTARQRGNNLFWGAALIKPWGANKPVWTGQNILGEIWMDKRKVVSKLCENSVAAFDF